jgi:SAM-dependent methyltransferase
VENQLGSLRRGADRLGSSGRRCAISHFSSVDASPDRYALVAYLNVSAAGLAAMKHYVAAAAHRAIGGGLVLDVGCGAGHDLALLTDAGVGPVGVDPSASMLSAAQERLGPSPMPLRLVQAQGERLPFRAGAFDGCRIERVLMHVDEPERVLSEIARIVRVGGFLAAFEPDWRALRFGASDPDDQVVATSVVNVCHPDIGRRLQQMAEAHGFLTLDRVSEVSFGWRIADIPLPLEVVLDRAVHSGRIEPTIASRWFDRQVALDRSGRFQASWTKVLLVARRR